MVSWSLRLRERASGVTLLVGLLVTASLVVLALRSPQEPTQDTARPPAVSADDLPASSEPSRPATARSTEVGTRFEMVQRRLVKAVSAQRFSAGLPSDRELSTAGWMRQASRRGCLDVILGDLASCRSGTAGAPLTAVVMGDETAISYLPMIRSALGKPFRIEQLTTLGCPVWSAPVRPERGTSRRHCQEFGAAAAREVRRLRPDLLIVSSSYQQADRLMSGTTGDAALEEVQTGYDEAMASLTPSARFTLVLSPPPGGRSIATCRASGSTPAMCVSPPPAGYAPYVLMEGGVARAHGALYVSTLGWFCAARRCPAAVGATAVYADGTRVTADYAKSLSRVFSEVLTALAGEATRN